MKNLQKLLETMEQRKNNTEKAKEELFSILEKLEKWATFANSLETLKKINGLLK